LACPLVREKRGLWGISRAHRNEEVRALRRLQRPREGCEEAISGGKERENEGAEAGQVRGNAKRVLREQDKTTATRRIKDQ